MVRALYVHRKEQLAKGRRLHAADEAFFRNAEKVLFEEFAAALGRHVKDLVDRQRLAVVIHDPPVQLADLQGFYHRGEEALCLTARDV